MITMARAPCDENVVLTAPEPAPVPPGAGPWVLASTILGSSMAFIDGTVVNVALPALQRNLGATGSEAQWVVESYALFLAALILVGGSLGDHLGRKRIYTAGVILFTAASVACGLAPNVTALIVARAVQGVGGAMLVPGSLAIISATFGGEARGRAIGTWSGFTTLTSALGPVLGGWLVQTISWRAVFLINVPLALAVLLITTKVPESRDEHASGGLDWLGAALVTLGLGGIVYGLIEWSAIGFGRPAVSIALALGVVALLLFLLVESRVAAPMLPLSLFQSRTFTGANLLTLLLYGALGGALYYLPFNLQQAQGYSAAAAGASFLPFTAIMFNLSRWAGGLVSHYGARLPLTVGPLITAGGFLLFSVPGRGGSYWTTYFPAVVVLAFGMAITVAPLTTVVMNAVSSDQSGIASGVNNAVSRAAGLLAIAILGIVVASSFSSNLDSRLARDHVTPAIRHALDAQQSRLAAARPPAGVDAATRIRLKNDIADAFVESFRLAMCIGAALALLSALCARLLIEDTAVAVRRTQAASKPVAQAAQ